MYHILDFYFLLLPFQHVSCVFLFPGSFPQRVFFCHLLNKQKDKIEDKFERFLNSNENFSWFSVEFYWSLREIDERSWKRFTFSFVLEFFHDQVGTYVEWGEEILFHDVWGGKFLLKEKLKILLINFLKVWRWKIYFGCSQYLCK